MITWLHISDLHFKSLDIYNSSIIHEAFFNDLVVFIREKSLLVDLVFITGDIAFSGNNDEYILANTFLDRLISTLNINKDRVFIVPGNHDINRKQITQLTEDLITSIDNRDKANNVLSSEEDINYICKKFSQYSIFLNNYFGDSLSKYLINKNLSNFTRLLSISGKKVAIIGLNSSWLSCGNNDRNNLLIGEKQIRESLERAKDADIKIAILHHPFNWLKEFDENESNSLLSSECHFILRGHLHKSKVEFYSSPDSNVLIIASGALYETRDNPNVYNFVQLNEVKGEGIIYLRRYSDESMGFFAKDTLTYQHAPDGEYTFSLLVTKGITPEISSDAFFSRISRIIINQNGLKRTAYPTDMNFHELYEKEVYVNPIFQNLSLEDSTNPFTPLDFIIEQIIDGSSLLILGEPGSGKSFLTYIIHRRLISAELKKTICLPIDLRLFIETFSDNYESLGISSIIKVFIENYKNQYNVLPENNSITSHFLFIVDGIDELSSNPIYIKKLPSILIALVKIGNIVVTCRTRDFDNIFAPLINPSMFDQIYKVKEWEVEKEFHEFIDKLVRADLFCDNGFYKKVRSTPSLRPLIQRPLYARMLTFISKPNLQELPDILQLYSDYLQKYSVIVDNRLIKEECLNDSKTYIIWSETAWFLFKSDLFLHDKVSFDAVSDFLIKNFNIRPSCVAKILYPIFNFIKIFNETLIQYVHYSFYEYFVAEYMANGLIKAYYHGSNDIYSYFSRDMTLEIRHHLMEILNKTKPKGFGKWLGHCYISNNIAAPNQVRRKIANNLLIYILGRLREDVSEDLSELLLQESDDFLRSCIYWGLCATAGVKGVEEYINILDKSVKMRNLNRGYLLYYYGDLDRSKDPPYLDDDPLKGWGNTKTRTLSFMAETNYIRNIGIGRRIIDLYTFFDFLIFRGERINEGFQTINNVLNSIEGEIGITNLLIQLKDMYKKVLGQKSFLEFDNQVITNDGSK